MFKEITALWCQCDKCTHEWLAWKTTGLPIRCAKCKSRKWNGGKFGVEFMRVPVKTETTFHIGDVVEGIPGISGVIDRVVSSDHDSKTCRVYRCGQCAAAGAKDAKRGVK